MENTFINSQMIPGHRYAQRFTTISEGAYYPVGLDRELTEYAKTHIVVSISPYTHDARVHAIVGYLADLTEERINNMCDDFIIKMASMELRDKKDPRSKEELRKDPAFIQFKTWCEDLVCWEDKNGFTDKPIHVGGGQSFMPPLLAVIVAAKDKEKVEYYKKLFPEYAKKVHEAKVAYFAQKEASTTIVTGQTPDDPCKDMW
jgi:hypothetical protein